MNLDDLKLMWQESDKDLENNMKINTMLLKEVTLGRVKSKLLNFTLGNIIELISYFIMLVLMLKFLIHHIDMPQFSIPASILLIFSLIELYGNIKGLELIYKMKYTTPVTELQKKMHEMRRFKFWNGHLMLIVTPIFAISLLVVGIKGLLNLDIFYYLSQNMWVYIITSSFIGSIIVWLIVRNDYKELDKLNAFLNDIKEFEEEK